MQPYQEEYIANLKEITLLTSGEEREGQNFEEFLERAEGQKRRAEEKAKRNMKLLREGLFPVLDHIFDADEEETAQLREFAGGLLSGRDELDVGLYCQVHKALLSLARQTKDRKNMIRELYSLGMGYYSISNKLVGLSREDTQKYISQMRLCFAEAAAYLKYFDEIEDGETRGYILRSRANMALGSFSSPSEKIRMVKRTLQILQDKGYQEKEPGLPWDRYIYMTHQQMAASISYSKDNTMTSEDIADVMESVYIVYQRRFQEAERKGEKPPLRPSFSYNTIAYFCGMLGLEELLAKMEDLMDGADPKDYSVDSMYSIISVPAFYCQFLNDYPEQIPKRKEYIENLYRRILDYVDTVPRAAENEALFLYLRQLSSTFVETEDSVLYKDFLLKLQMHFTPEIYIHSRMVAEMAAAFCGMIMDEEPWFFDDIEEICRIEEAEEKRRRAVAWAAECGMLHDVGKINFLNLYAQTARQWFEEEYEMAHLHTLMGANLLEARASTRIYASVAMGHHFWYDGSRGYPEAYQRLECPCRQMVDVIGLFDWISNVTDTARLYTGIEKTFEEAVREAVALEGRRFSPLLTARLRDEKIVSGIKAAFETGRREAYRQLYALRT